MSTKMTHAKRWRMLAKEKIVIEDFDPNEKPLQPREIRIRSHFTAISPGTECANYLALDPDVNIPGKWCSYPWMPGYSGCGEVIELGSAVKNYKVGDMVVGFVPHATHCTCPVDDVIPLDPRLAPELATYLRLLSIAYTPLIVMRQEALPAVGVWGLGMIGNLVAQLLRRSGGRVIGIDPVPERRALAERCGIAETLDPTVPKFREKLTEMLGGAELDIAVEATGHAPTTLSLPSFIRVRGQMILMTSWRSQPVVDANDFILNILCRGISLHGAHECAPGWEIGIDEAALKRRKYLKLQHELVAGNLAIEPLISHRIKPAQAKEAYDGLSFDRSKWWGVVVDWRD